MTDTLDIVEQCRNFCGENARKCSSGDTCVPVMHDEPCYGELADEIEKLRERCEGYKGQAKHGMIYSSRSGI